MTNEEAKEIMFEQLQSFIPDYMFYGRIAEAYKMAIKALEQQPCECTEHPCLGKLCKYYKQPCEDCISKEAVDTLVDELARAISDERCYLSRGRDTTTIMQDILDMPSVTPKTRWIPCSERLPEKNIEVLVTTKWDNITIGEMLSGNDWLIYEGTTYAIIDDIKAWMPLPQPYKEESEE